MKFMIHCHRVLSGFTIFILVSTLFFLSGNCFSQVTFQSNGIQLSTDKTGRISGLTIPGTGFDYLQTDSASWLISLISGEKRYFPDTFNPGPVPGQILVTFGKTAVQVTLMCQEKTDYLVFEVIEAEPADQVDAICWGPLHTTISQTVGEVVGVVSDDRVSLGMLPLNAKTLGGHYNKSGVFEGRGSLALTETGGSSLQAYSLNRDRSRSVDAMGLTSIPVKPIPGETVTGSRIALFSCTLPETLDRIEEIVKAENLPFLTSKGNWVKKAFRTSRSYLISDFKESEIDEVIGHASKGGFFSVYHEGPFRTWGHYDPDTAYFPNGINGFRTCAEKARKAGLYFGVHCLTNFINTNDRYVTPVPDHRLAITGYGLLTKDVDSMANEIPVSTREYFGELKNNNLHTVMIGKELIRYQSVTEQAPYKLTGCERGAFGTKRSIHNQNDTVSKLFDHPYLVFFPNLELQREIAINLAKFFNAAGISHLDFDGHEGCYASGEGDYAYNLFAEDFARTMDHEFVNGTSNSKPYYWYINTLCNWGEPWYGGFKESMQEYRISNQAMLSRNYLPNMLGWYMLTKNTTLPEMEWMLARAAGWNAGFAMVVRMKAARANPAKGVLLDAIREWESARLTNAFSKEQKERLKDSRNEFHLEKVKEKEWDLFQFASATPVIHENSERQPGEPTHSKISFNLDSFRQPLKFMIEIQGDTGLVKNCRLVVDNFTELFIPDEILANETVICDGSGMIRIYDKSGKQKKSLDYSGKIPDLDTGNHSILINMDFSGDELPHARVVLKWMKQPERIRAETAF
jgi:hypothetical protein